MKDTIYLFLILWGMYSVNLLLNFLFILMFGLNAAAILYCVGFVAGFAAVIWTFYRRNAK